MEQLDLTKWIAPTSKIKSNTQEIIRVLNQVKKWDYIPTPLCIQETFGLSHGTSCKVFDTLINEECKKTKGWQQNIKVFEYIRKKVVFSRSRFEKYLLKKQAQKILRDIGFRLPPVRRREF